MGVWRLRGRVCVGNLGRVVWSFECYTAEFGFYGKEIGSYGGFCVLEGFVRYLIRCFWVLAFLFVKWGE